MMLSKEDYTREIGKNIFIYPLDYARILGNSIDLTASEFAWTSTGKNIYDEKTGVIKVPPHETACILTREAIYVTSDIGGTYHSRVSMAQKGFSHLGTMLDPEYYGQSLIVMHNITDKELEINAREHERIVSIIFYYLKTPILTESHKPNPGHLDKIEHYENYLKYKRWSEENRWASEKRELVSTFLSSDSYKKFKEKREIDEKVWESEGKRRYKALKERWEAMLSKFKQNIFKYVLLCILSCLAVCLCLKVFSQSDSPGAIVTATIIVVLLTTISNDLKST